MFKTLHQRLIEAGAYDLRIYRKITDLGNGYCRVEQKWSDDRQRYGEDDEKRTEYYVRMISGRVVHDSLLHRDIVNGGDFT